MKHVRLILIAVLIGLMLPFGLFAQKGGGNSNRPPKDKPQIVDEKKKQPPPTNSNRGRPE